MRYCSNCGLLIKPEALECNFCDTPIQDSIQNADFQQPIVQQPMVQHQPMAQPQYVDQLQPMGQHQPMVQQQPIGQSQSVEQLQPMGQYQPINQIQPMAQPQYMDQLQPMGQPQPIGQSQPMGQQPMRQQQPMGQQQYMNQQPIGQPQPPYHQPQQPYSQSPPFQQPTYQQSQQSRGRQSHNQQSSGQRAYDGYSQHAQTSHLNVTRPGIGGWLLFFVITFIIIEIYFIFFRFAGIGSVLDFMTYGRWMFPDDIMTSIYVRSFAEIIGIGSIVFAVIAIVQTFRRKSTFLRFLQLSWFSFMLCNFILYIASNMMITQFSLFFAEQGISHQFRQFLEASGLEFTQRDIIQSIVLTVLEIFLLTLYFSKSRRVWAYMGDEEYKEKAFFAFNRPPT